jgi:hypothetical protein
MPASRRGGAERCRRGWTEAGGWRTPARAGGPAGSLDTGAGPRRGGACPPDPPTARRGQEPPRGRGVGPDGRRPARVLVGHGPDRSGAPWPPRTWTSIRARSLAGPGRWGPSGRRSPQASKGVRPTRARRSGRGATRVRTAATRRRTGRCGARGARPTGRVDQARVRVGAEQHGMPHRARGRARREEGVTCWRERTEARSAASGLRAGAGGAWVARWWTALPSLSRVRADRPRSCRASRLRGGRGVLALPPVPGGGWRVLSRRYRLTRLLCTPSRRAETQGEEETARSASFNNALQLTASSLRSCLAVRRDSSNRIPENRVGNRRNVPKVSRLTGAETGRRDQSMAAKQEAQRRRRHRRPARPAWQGEIWID